MNEYIRRQLQLAEEIAVANHEGQFRRDGKTAYIEHVECVAGHFKGDENDWTQKCVAYLHDVVEDTELTIIDLENIGVDGAVVAAVDALTKKKGTDYFDYLEAVAQNRVARQVKVADILSNLLDNPTAEQVSKYSKALLQLAGN